MKSARDQRSARPAPSRDPTALRARLAELEDTLRAIRAGEVDAVMVAGKRGPQVFTLEGAEHAYRVLIESMNEGALILTADHVILYANKRFASMVKCPLEQVIGSSLRRFLSDEDRRALQPLVKRADKSGSIIQARLSAVDGSHMPAQISIRPLARRAFNRATVAVVVTDMTEARRTEELLRALSHRVVRAQEAERSRVAVELHDHVTQHLCAILFRSQALAERLSASDGPSKEGATRLREMLGKTAAEVERISRDLRPSVLNELGLVDALRAAGVEFEERTSVSIKLVFAKGISRLPADIELTLYRIFHEALENVERHALARHVTVSLRLQATVVQMVIHDDGIGFDQDFRPVRRKGKGGFGLLSMRERAAYLGGTLKVKAARRAGTEIEVRIPLSPGATTGD